jgi:flavorubredoxin
MATVTEIAPDIFRINIAPAGSFLTYSFFVIRDEQPALVETGFHRTFVETLDAVKQVIDPASLRYIVIPHVEGDESGAMNDFLGQALQAVAVGSPTGVRTNLNDLAIRAPLMADEQTVLELGTHRLRFLLTPYVHTWDSMMAVDDTSGTIFTSDVFIQPGPGPAVTEHDRTEEMVATYRQVGIFPSRPHLNAALDKIEAAHPRVLACHHGSVIGSKIEPYFRALREHDVTGLSGHSVMQEQVSSR